MKGRKQVKLNRRAVIDCGNEDDVFLAYLAIFRYCFGRMTYMPQVCVDIFKANAEHLTERTLDQLDTELAEEAKRYERLNKCKPPYNNYGMDCDRELWLAFHEWVKAQKRARKESASAAQA